VKLILKKNYSEMSVTSLTLINFTEWLSKINQVERVETELIQSKAGEKQLREQFYYQFKKQKIRLIVTQTGSQTDQLVTSGQRKKKKAGTVTSEDLQLMNNLDILKQ